MDFSNLMKESVASDLERRRDTNIKVMEML